ncbi:hypothetical protein DFH09DRAFT_1091454 [Mycena vulgaris]|nr:hypothetical protein DFH09DRAFT_1091454 [Mycena vulgaris]
MSDCFRTHKFYARGSPKLIVDTRDATRTRDQIHTNNFGIIHNEPPNQIHCAFLLYPPSSLAPMDEIGPAAAQKINQIVAAADEEHLAAYIKQTFPSTYCTAESAVNWLDIDKFMWWLNHAAAVSVPSTPAHRAPSAHRPVPGSTPMHSLAAHQSSPNIPPAALTVQSGPSRLQQLPQWLENYHKALDRSHTREEMEGTDEQVKTLKGKIKRPVASGKKTRGKREDSSDEAGPGLAPVPAAYAEQAAFLSAPMLSNLVVQLNPALEPSFPPGAGYENLDGNLED